MFTNGHAYDYLAVEPFMWEGLRASPSAGAFLNKIIKKQHFTKII